MSVSFIVGRSGTGKTRLCIEEILGELAFGDKSENLILLVPEQSTYQAERAILSDGRVKGFSRLGVLSFNRLAFWLMGKDVEKSSLSPLGREMVVSKILAEKSEQLEAFGSCCEKQGLAAKVSDMLVEFQKYDKQPGDVSNLIEQMNAEGASRNAVEKFGDLENIYADYLKFIDGRFSNPDVQLTQAAKVVRESEFVKNAKVWVDGFSSFNGQERELLISLLSSAKKSRVAFCLDPFAECFSLVDANSELIDETSIFSPTERTYCEVVEILRKLKVGISKPTVLKKNHRLKKSDSLGFVEKNIFARDVENRCSDDGAIEICSVKDSRSEVEFAAKKIIELVREGGYRWRDISVVVSDLEGYSDFLRSIFSEYRIPFFIDQRQSVGHHPLVELLSSAFSAVHHSYSLVDVLSFLKTGLAGVDQDEIEVLENYCVANGISGDDWVRDESWNFGTRGVGLSEKDVDAIRRRAVGDLVWLGEEFEGSVVDGKISCTKFVGVVFGLLERLDVRKKLSAWIEAAVEKGDVQKADEHRQLYDRFVDVLDEMVEVFGEDRLSVLVFEKILTDALGQLKLAFVPPCQDQVMVGSIERSRHPDIRAMFLLGVTQKQFPVPASSSSVLTDEERSLALRYEFEIAENLSQQLVARQYFVYIAFTRASEKLFVCYPWQSEKGTLIQRSSFVDQLCELFEDGLVEKKISVSIPRLEECVNEYQLQDNLCWVLGDESESGESEKLLASSLLNESGLVQSWDDHVDVVARAIGYNNQASIESETARKLYGDSLRCSVSRISSFAECPYKHFAQYALRLKKRSQFKLEPFDVGNFYHGVLDKVAKYLKASGLDFASVDDQKLMDVLRDQIAAYLQEESFLENFKNHSGHNNYVIDSACEVLEDCVRAIGKISSAGDFKVCASEVSFGRKDSKWAELELNDAKGRKVRLNGIIDRVDTAEIDGKLVAMVYDYKTSGKKFDFGSFYHGLDMQLVVYLLAVEGKEFEGREIVAGGGFYVPIEAMPSKIEYDEIEKTNESFAYKLNGIFDGEYAYNLDSHPLKSSSYYNFRVTNKDREYGYYSSSGILYKKDFGRVLEFARKKIVELTSRIMDGDVEVRPYRKGGKSPCGWCDYRSLCRFDWQINNYDSLEKVNKKTMFEQLDGGVI